MIKTWSSKLKMILTLTLIMVVSFYVGIVSFAKAEPTISSLTEITSFKMDGADLFYDGNKTGLKFSASISKEEYDFVNYSNVTTGLIIAPKYYDDTIKIDKSSLFTETASYDFATYTGGDWAYDEGDKIRVININSNDWVLCGDKYVYSGAIVDVLDKNVCTVFVGKAYLNLGEEYLFTDNAYSSIFEQVNALPETPDWIPTNWIDQIRPSNYSVNFCLSSIVGNNTVNCTYMGQENPPAVTINYGEKFLDLVKAKPHARYSDDYVFDCWIYVDGKGNSVTITSSTTFDENIFWGGNVTLIAQCKRSPYGPTIS